MKSKLLVILAVLMAAITTASGQNQIHDLAGFNQIVVSPRINLVLIKGDLERLEIETRNIDYEKVNFKVKGRTLQLYLDNARKYVKHNKYTVNGHHYKEKQYRGTKVTAYVTYRDLKKLQVRGEQWVIAEAPIVVDKFKLKVYGQSDINLASIKTRRLKVGLYGENNLDINSGATKVQRFRSFGENRIDTRKMASQKAKTSVFGEADFSLTVTNKLKVSSMGETHVSFSGPANVNKGIVLGKSEIRKIGSRY